MNRRFFIKLVGLLGLGASPIPAAAAMRREAPVYQFGPDLPVHFSLEGVRDGFRCGFRGSGRWTPFREVVTCTECKKLYVKDVGTGQVFECGRGHFYRKISDGYYTVNEHAYKDRILYGDANVTEIATGKTSWMGPLVEIDGIK